MNPDEETPKHISQNRQVSESKLRRSRKNCPICLEPLAKNARRTKLMAACVECRAHPSRGKHCSKCGAEAVWENKQAAACQACGLHGSKAQVAAKSVACRITTVG